MNTLTNKVNNQDERVFLDAKQCPQEGLIEHLARYIFATRYVNNNNVLDVASGTGYGSFILGGASASSVLGLDGGFVATDWAKRNYARENVEFLQYDAQKIVALEKKFDLIVSYETIEHLEDYTRFLDGVKQCLALDGTFIVSTPYRLPENTLNGKPRNPHHRIEWTFLEFQAVLNSFFPVIQWFTQGLRIKKGPFPFSRTFRSRAIKRWYSKNGFYPSPRGFEDVAIRPFPVSLESFVEGKYLIAVCGIEQKGNNG